MTSLSSFVVAFVVSPSLSSFVGSLVAGALISNNGAPWWTTFGDGGGQNNCCVRKISVSAAPGLGRFSQKIKIICCQTFCATYVGSRRMSH